VTSASSLKPLTVTRLAFIRQLYQQGLEQSHLPEPLALTSVLTFHDAVELFLVLAGEHLSLPGRPREFMKYWAELHPDKLTNGIALTGELGMERLNRLRVSFKHLGTMPSPAAIELARADVTVFFEDNTSAVFGIPFSGIEMADLIPQPTVRDKAKSATKAAVASDRIEAMGQLAEAMDELLDGPHIRRPDHPTQPFSIGPNLSWPLDEHRIRAVLQQPDPQHRNMPARGAESLARQISTVTAIASAAQAALRIITLGVDYHRYNRFQQLTPRIHHYMDGRIERSYPRGYDPNQEEFDYCQQFLITVALRLAQVEADTMPPSWTATTGA
jgi:hypothetical protein